MNEKEKRTEDVKALMERIDRLRDENDALGKRVRLQEAELYALTKRLSKIKEAISFVDPDMGVD